MLLVLLEGSDEARPGEAGDETGVVLRESGRVGRPEDEYPTVDECIEVGLGDDTTLPLTLELAGRPECAAICAGVLPPAELVGVGMAGAEHGGNGSTELCL